MAKQKKNSTDSAAEYLYKSPYFITKPFREERARHEALLEFWSGEQKRIDAKIKNLPKKHENVYWRVWRIKDLILQQYYDYECADNPNNLYDIFKTYQEKNLDSSGQRIIHYLFDRTSRLDSILNEVMNLTFELEELLDSYFAEE